MNNVRISDKQDRSMAQGESCFKWILAACLVTGLWYMFNATPDDQKPLSILATIDSGKHPAPDDDKCNDYDLLCAKVLGWTIKL
jgi:hypothetical protein